MRSLKKVLSALLAITLVFTTMTIGVDAAYSAYKDDAITGGYDSIDKPILTTDQYASMAMDEVDRMLGEANLLINYDLAGILTINADLTSIDKTLDSIEELWGTVSNLSTTIKGDIPNLNFSALTSAPRRADVGSTDADIFEAVFQFLADNAGILAKLPKGTTENGGIDLGLVGSFVDITEYLDLTLLAKEAVAGLVYPDYEDDPAFATFDPKSMTLDQYISEFIDLVVEGTYNPEKSDTINKISGYIQQYIPGINNQVDLVEDSVYDIVENGFRIALNSVLVPLANSRLKKLVRKLCGVVYTEVTDAYGKPVLDADGDKTYTQDATNLNKYAELFDINFTITSFDISGWGTESFVTHANDILGHIVEAIANPENLTVNWSYANGNADIVPNIINVAKSVLAATGNEFFASYVEVLSTAEINEMSNDEFVAYLLRSILNGSISDVFIPNTCTSIETVCFELVKSLAANLIPSRDYSNTTAYPADIDGILSILSDMAVSGINRSTNMDLEYGLSIDELADACMTWVENNYGGFVSAIEGTGGWERLSFILFSIIPASWLPLDDFGSERSDVYAILMDDIVTNIINLDFENILALLDRNTSEDADLNGTIIEVLLGRIVAIFNYIIPGTFSDAYTYDTLESLLNPDLLSDLIYNLITGLNDRVPTLMPSILPLLCSILGLSSEEEFGYPYISLPETLDLTKTTSFYMYNGSSGINTAATDKNGSTTRDNLYTYRITSIETNQADVTVSPATATINGGKSQTFTLVGTPEDEAVLTITITYDVYEENGLCMTPNPLTATCVSFVSSRDDDGDTNAKADASSANYHLVYYKSAKYITTDNLLSALNGIEFTPQRNVCNSASQHYLNSTISLQSSAIDPTLEDAGVTAGTFAPQATTPNGGAWTYTPYVVTDNTATLPDEGLYTSNFTFYATATQSAIETIPFSQYVYIYNDYGLPGLLSAAVNSNRQQANYSQGYYSATYVDFDTNQAATGAVGEVLPTTTESVNGANVWAEYVAAVEAAAAIVYRPRLVNSFEETHASLYYDAAYALYTAIQQLESGSLSSGAAGVKTALETFVAPTTTVIDPETNEEVNVKYYENGYTFFGSADYIGYTYDNFKRERRAAESLINKWEEGEAIDAIEAAYTEHRLTLYGNRLVRVRAYTDHLADELAIANTVTASHYSAESWQKFLNARTFAAGVVTESIGSTIGSTENLSGNGLRQTKVNTARSELIAARKKLVSSVDYTQLNAAISAAAAIFTAGNAAGTYTALSWTAFDSAYTAATAAVDAKYQWSNENQTIVDSAATALTQAFGALESAVSNGFTPIEDAVIDGEGNGSTLTIKETGITSQFFSTDTKFITGMNQYVPSIEGAIETTGSWSYQVDYSDAMAYEPDSGFEVQSTGTKVNIYDGDNNLVDSYWLVLYGDINGDGLFDATDNNYVVGVPNYEFEWAWVDSTEDNPYFYASDVNHDGIVDGADDGILTSYINYEFCINQQWATEGDAVTDMNFA